MISIRMLAIILSNFGKELGLSPKMAEVTAKTFLLMNATSVENIFAFFETSCSNCQKNPETCPYFNPTGVNVRTEEVLYQNLQLINRGRSICPIIQNKEKK